MERLKIPGYVAYFAHKRKKMIDGGLVTILRDDWAEGVKVEYKKFRFQGRKWDMTWIDTIAKKGYQKITWKDREWGVVNVHLVAHYLPVEDYTSQERQQKQMFEDVAGKKWLVAGDFNMPKISLPDGYVDLTQKLGKSMIRARKRIDYVLTNMEKVRAKVGYVYYSDMVSDHKGIVAEVIY